MIRMSSTTSGCSSCAGVSVAQGGVDLEKSVVKESVVDESVVEESVEEESVVEESVRCHACATVSRHASAVTFM